MTTDNRTNEPTPEQIEAAAQAVRGVDARAGLIADVDLPMYRARAALVAAAGVAPQAPSEYAYCPIHGDLLAANRSYRCGNAPTGHEYAATVQPLSTVDEAALTEVLSETVKTYAAYYKPEPFETYAARAVAEYLTGGTK